MRRGTIVRWALTALLGDAVVKKRWCAAAVLVAVLPLLVVVMMFPFTAATIRSKRDAMDFGARMTRGQEFAFSVADLWSSYWHILAPLCVGAALTAAVSCRPAA